mmetsp:Transcript_18749/g.22986  ORF Transcript_18749/g.22986 Transcript_18749/m.22986 type:complete len:314 (-) Transcript_18749:282-1223(-)
MNWNINYSKSTYIIIQMMIVLDVFISSVSAQQHFHKRRIMESNNNVSILNTIKDQMTMNDHHTIKDYMKINDDDHHHKKLRHNRQSHIQNTQLSSSSSSPSYSFSTSTTSRQTSSTTATTACEEDQNTIDESNALSTNFSELLDAVDTSLNEEFQNYCTTTINRSIGSSTCLVDYSTFVDEVEKYNDVCTEVIGATPYPVSILMKCSNSDIDGFLEMELLNVPSCVGKTCDAGNLYHTLINVLYDIQSSLGENEDWDCNFYHDFESLLNAPTSVISLLSDTDNDTGSGGTSGKLSTTAKIASIVFGFILFEWL